MELNIQNFRGFPEKDINFPKNGIVTINGSSGAGKTTIFDSIMFALFDLKSNIYPKDVGALTTHVELKFNNITISRQKRPNVLTVVKDGISYIDDAAQTVINEYFGKKGCWDMSSYIAQGKNHNFMELSSVTKMDIISNMALGDGFSSSSLESQIAKMLKDENENFSKSKIDYGVAQKMFEPCKKNEDLQTCNIKEVKSEYSKIEKERKDLENRYNELKSQKAATLSVIELSSQFNEDLSDIMELDIVDVKNKLQEKKKVLQELKVKYKEAQRVWNYKQEYDAIQERVLKLTPEVLQMYSSCDYVKGDYEKYTEWLKLHDEHEKYLEYIKKKKDIDRLQCMISAAPEKSPFEEIGELKVGLKDLQCPNCDHDVYYHDHKLHKEKKEYNENLISKLEDDIPKYQKRKINEQKLKELTLNFKELPKPKHDVPKITKQKILSVLPILKEKKQVYDSMIKSNVCINEEQTHHDEMRRRNALLKFIINPVDPKPIKDEISSCEKEILSLNNHVKILTYIANSKISSISDIKKEIKKCIAEDKIRRVKLEKLHKKIKDHKSAVEYLNLEDDLKMYRDASMKIHGRLSACNSIKLAVTSATCEMINNFLLNLNHIVNSVLKDLFDEPIILKMKSFKELKTSSMLKPQLNVEIIYKGNAYSGFSGLSGGEKSRISIGMLIAFAKLHMKPSIILLDECISSLNVSMKDRVVESLKEHLPKSLILMINHDTSDSNYDCVVNV